MSTSECGASFLWAMLGAEWKDASKDPERVEFKDEEMTFFSYGNLEVIPCKCA